VQDWTIGDGRNRGDQRPSKRARAFEQRPETRLFPVPMSRSSDSWALQCSPSQLQPRLSRPDFRRIRPSLAFTSGFSSTLPHLRRRLRAGLAPASLNACCVRNKHAPARGLKGALLLSESRLHCKGRDLNSEPDRRRVKRRRFKKSLW
jgi:hypothetical protein